MEEEKFSEDASQEAPKKEVVEKESVEKESVKEEGRDEEARPEPDPEVALEEKVGHPLPFQLIVRLGGEELDDKVFDQDVVKIGRDHQGDVVVDNLGASREHARIERIGRFFLLRDMKSKSGTFVRGKKIEEYCLNSGDEIFLAKHTLVFNKLTSLRWHGKEEAGRSKAASKEGAELNQTMAVDFRNMAKERGPAPARMQMIGTKRMFPVTKNAIFFGKSPECDFLVNGFLVSEKHVLMVNERKGYVLVHLGFWNPPKINDRPVNSALLKEGDTVQIADFHFVFHAPESE